MNLADAAVETSENRFAGAFFEVSRINGNEDLVKSSKVLYERKTDNSSSGFIFSPLVILGLLSVVILFITYKDFKAQKRSKWLDVTLFSLTGIIGVLLLLLWFGTDHTATWQNYNLLWACPLNILAIRQLLKNDVKNWVKSYLKFLIIMLCLMTLHWLIGVQVFAIALIPLLIALVIRYIYLVKSFNS